MFSVELVQQDYKIMKLGVINKMASIFFKYYEFLNRKMQGIENHERSILYRCIPPLKFFIILIITSYILVSIYGPSASNNPVALTIFYTVALIDVVYAFNIYFMIIYSILGKIYKH